MKRGELEHVIRAACQIADDDELIIIGSQSILGAAPDAPASLLVSNEADVYPKNHPDRADLVDGTIGEGSPFHDTFGYYAQGVGEETAILPRGWKTRLVPVRNANTRDCTGWCLEPHDLVVAKYQALAFSDGTLVVGDAWHDIAADNEWRQHQPGIPDFDRTPARVSVGSRACRGLRPSGGRRFARRRSRC